MSFTKKVNVFLSDAVAQGVVDQEVEQKLNSFAKKYEGKSAVSFLNLVGFFGAVAVLLGIILIISHNWYQITNSVKILAYLALLAGFHFIGFFLRQEYPKTSQVIYFLTAGYVLAGIGLIAQIFHLSSKSGEAYLAWSLMILPMAILLRNSWIGIMAMGGFYLWVNINANLNFYEFDYKHSVLSEILYITAICSNMVLLSRTFIRLNESFNQVKNLGYVTLGVITLVMGFSYKISGIKFAISISLHPLTIFIMVFNVACLANGFLKRLGNNAKLSDLIQLPETYIVALTLAPLLLGNNALLTAILYWAIWFIGGGAMIYKGEQERSKNMINVGSWCIMIGIIIRFLDIVRTMKFTGSMFILFGMILITIAFIGERYRKNLINKTFVNHVSSK